MVDQARADVEAAIEAGDLEAAKAVDISGLSGEDQQIVARLIAEAEGTTTESGFEPESATTEASDDTSDDDAEPDLESMTVAQLKDLAAERDVEINPTDRKADIIEALQDAEAE